MDIELIVHIGTGKTGSSSIQKTLSASAEGLARQGVAYIGLMGEESPVQRYPWQRAGAWAELVGLGGEAAQQQLGDLLLESLREAAAKGCPRVIWSNESIFGNHQLILPVLQQVRASGVKLAIIAYIRRHDAWARSAYLQWGLKHKTTSGPVRAFREWYQERKISFSSGIKPWLAADWDHIAVRNFDAAGDVVTDFLQVYGIARTGLRFKQDNETPNAVALALWAMYNSQIEEPVLPMALERVLKQAGLLERAPLGSDFASLLPDAADLERVARETRVDRESINEIFQRFGQPAMDTSPLRLKAFEVSQYQINAALLMMIKSQADQVTRLKHQVKALLDREQ